MEYLKLFVDFVEAAAWPAVFLWLIWLVRPHFDNLISRVKNISLPGGTSFDLTQEVETAVAMSESIGESKRPEGMEHLPKVELNNVNQRLLSLGLTPSPSGLDPNYYRKLIDDDPNLALAGVRLELEIHANNLAKGFNKLIQNNLSAIELYDELWRLGVINTNQKNLAHQIIHVCNHAIHGTPVSKQDAHAIMGILDLLAKQYIEWLSWGFPDERQPFKS